MTTSRFARVFRFGAAVAVAVPFALGAAACGGSEPAAQGPSAPPPTLPPSFGGPAGPPGATPSPAGADMPSTAAASSPDVVRGSAALDADNLPTAKAAFEAALKKNPKDAEALTGLGRVLEKRGDADAAEKSYKDALDLRPDLEPAAEYLSALYDDKQRWDDAARVARAGIAKHPNDAALHLSLGIAFAGKGDAAGAPPEFDLAAKAAPNDPLTLLTAGHWLGVLKQNDAALAKFRAARAMSNDRRVLAGVGHEMRLVGAFGDCVVAYDKAVAAGDAAELRTERGLCKLGAKDDAGATADFQAAIAADPKYAPAHFYLAGRLAAQAKWKDVVTEYETYLKLEPNGPVAKTAAERVKLAREKLAGKK